MAFDILHKPITYIYIHQVLFQATWPTHIIHTKTHNAHKNTRKHRNHIKHTKKDKTLRVITLYFGYTFLTVYLFIFV